MGFSTFWRRHYADLSWFAKWHNARHDYHCLPIWKFATLLTATKHRTAGAKGAKKGEGRVGNMLLNCDLGESYGSWSMGDDASVMPHIDMANIACGMHAGDPLTITRTLQLAARHAVRVGAHPSYPDLSGFGRRSMHMEEQELIATMLYQVSALDGMAASQNLTLAHVKPHGALYHDMRRDERVRGAIFSALAQYQRPLPLVIQATPLAEQFRAEAQAAGVEVMFEAFADRRYTDAGALLARSEPDAILSRSDMLQQVAQLKSQGCVTTTDGNMLKIQADTLCVHGDNPECVAAIADIRALLKST